MSSSKESNNIAPPAPILLVDNYPSAPTILSSNTQTTISSPTLQYDIRQGDEPIELNNNNSASAAPAAICTILSHKNNIMYYYQEPAQQQQQQKDQLLIPFYNRHKKAIWKLTNRDWHGMTLIYQHLIIVLSTTPPQFRFTFNKQFYHWQVHNDEQNSYALKCYETESKKLIAQLDQHQIVLDIIPTTAVESNNTNPFRQSTMNHDTIDDDPFTMLVILSGLLVNNHIKILLKSLGGGPEALQMIIDPPAATNQQQHKEANAFHNMYNSNINDQQQVEDNEEDDDITSLSSNYPRYYPGHQSLVDERGSRWSSSAQSFKSIELDPGVWHCWWGYKFWWSWFPCCMPGGYCDRACIRLKGHKPKHRTNTRTLSKQGWQQQHY